MKLSLSKISFLNIMITALVITVVVGIFTITITNNSYESRIKDQDEAYIKKNKELVKNEVERVIKRIDSIDKILYSSIRDNLEEKVDFVNNLMSDPANHSLTKTQILAKYKSELDHLKWNNKNGYFYIFDADGTIFYHGGDSSYVNKNILDLDVLQGNAELEYFIKNSLKQNEYFGSYHWGKPHVVSNKLYEKFVYAKKINHLNIYIAAGIYKHEFEKNVHELIFKELESERFGDNNYGYFWIHSLDYKMLMHPEKELVGTDLEKLKTYDGQYLFQNINKLVLEKSGGFVSYRWELPDTKYVDEKISYVHLIKGWNVVIGSGFYLTELKKIHTKEEKLLKQSIYDNLKKILLILSVLILLSLFSALFISKRIKKMEESQNEYMHMLEQYKLVLDSSSIVSKTDKSGIITYVNSNFTNVSGYLFGEAIGANHNIVRHPESPKSQFKRLWKNITKGRIWKALIKNKKKNGESYYVSTTIIPIKESDGTIIEYISAGYDVTELIENRIKLKSIFSTDPLTGLENRVSLINFLNQHQNGVLALINIDRFKEVNDIRGYPTGDAIIKELGSRLFNFISDEKYILYRVQADVFALYTLKESQETLLKRVSEFMDTIGAEAYVIDENSFIFTYTVGIASEDENLLSYADMALSEAKNKKIRIKVYDDSMSNIQVYRQNILWMKKLHVALLEDRIIPYYQPIYNYHTGEVEKYECLMRLIEDGEVVLPSHYLPTAKKTKLYPELTYKIAAKSIDKFSLCSREFSINLSVEDLMNEKLMQFIYDYAEQKEVFKQLVLEIVESEEIEDSDSISKTIAQFKAAGVKIAIDDFGSGYSNYNYLISLKADYVKIDGSFIERLLDDERAVEIVKSLVNFAKKSNMKTIAEFVSTKELDAIVRSLGIDYAQGWFYGEAEPTLLSEDVYCKSDCPLE